MYSAYEAIVCPSFDDFTTRLNLIRPGGARQIWHMLGRQFWRLKLWKIQTVFYNNLTLYLEPLVTPALS